MINLNKLGSEKLADGLNNGVTVLVKKIKEEMVNRKLFGKS